MRGEKGQTYQDWVGSDSWREGQEAERSFGDLVKAKHPDIREATLEEQYRHIDWVCSAGTIDVKGIKRRGRGGGKCTDLVWVEFKNNTGDKGWLYGDQDFIAFEMDDSFIIVRRGDLKNICEELCDLDKIAERASDALYKGYSRRNRSDLTSMIRRSDLLKIKHSIINKNVSLL